MKIAKCVILIIHSNVFNVNRSMIYSFIKVYINVLEQFKIVYNIYMLIWIIFVAYVNKNISCIKVKIGKSILMEMFVF